MRGEAMLMNLDGIVREYVEWEDALRRVEGIAGVLDRLGESCDWSDAYDGIMLRTLASTLHDAAAVLAVELRVARIEGAMAD